MGRKGERERRRIPFCSSPSTAVLNRRGENGRRGEWENGRKVEMENRDESMGEMKNWDWVKKEKN